MAQLPPERWNEVSPYLDQALSLPDIERANLVATLREENSSLADLLQTLLNEHRFLVKEQFLEKGPLNELAIAGQKLGPYQVEELLGSGGMGEVYRALDTRLNRTVAIKVLPPHFSLDPERRRRFEREAKAISALQNRNICVLYDIGRQGDVDYLVMEYLEGETVGQWIQRTRTRDVAERLVQLLDISVQIACGLEAAHQKGIVHRDIKPANVFLTCSGEVKILDFGIAESSGVHESATEPGASTMMTGATLPHSMTLTGLAVGTPFYLSPEQIRGAKIDSRTDLFSFGLVLYEMATGQRAFSGAAADEIRESVLSSEPTLIRKHDPGLPAELERIVQKALKKDCEQRYQSATELSADLDRLKRKIEFRKAAQKRWRSPWTLSVAGVLSAAMIAGGLYYRSRQKQRLTEKDTIVLADFANTTGEKVFDSTLNQALSFALNQSPFLDVLSGDAVRKTLQSMARPVDTTLAPEVAREVCQRTNSRVYILGSIAGLGNQYVVGLKAVNCRTGGVLAQEQAIAASKERVLRALDSAATKLRGELGESLASLQKFDLPLEDATTSSLQALEAFSTGEAAARKKGEAAALPYHLRAIGLDPNFAIAYLSLGSDYTALGETTRASQYYSKAFELRDHASRLENMEITSDYYLYVTGELEKAEQALHNLLANFPRHWGAHTDLGNVYTSQGLYAKGAEEYREAISFSDEAVTGHTNLANSLLALQRLDETRQELEHAQALKLDEYVFHLEWYALAFLKGDPQGIADQQRWFAGRPEVGYNGIALASDTEAFAGHLKKSRELTREAVDSAIRADDKESGAILEENAALREAAFSNATEAKRLASEGLKLSPESQGVEVEAALALAMTGDTSRPTSLTKKLEGRYPLDTQVHALWLSPIQAQLALDRKNPTAALAALPDIGAMELGQISFLNNISCLYETYTRGNVLLAAGNGASAATEFQKIIDHSGIVWNCWTGALAHLGLARANALQARTSQSAEAVSARDRALADYIDFLTLWKEADPDIPLLKQAKSEYVKLQQLQTHVKAP
jgi:serine/threonine protein kinase/tetratricopeptide (TPR) repeat protein